MYAAIFLVCGVFIFRLFQLQVLNHDFYIAQAQDSQLRRYEIPAERGVLYAYDGGERVPIVLNELRYNIVADPQIIDDKDETAFVVADVLGVSAESIRTQLDRETRYEILAKKQNKAVKERIEQLYADGEIVGVFAEQTVQREYPNGALASQTLGFVDDDGSGRYGVEEFLQDQLSGSPGRVRALTDQNGIPLLASGDNVVEEPTDGQDVTLTLDVAMQRQLENILKQGLDRAESESGSAIIMDPNNGAVLAIANYPSYDPANFQDVEDAQLFTNPAVSAPLEPGSIMKTLTAAAALDAGVVAADQTYFDPAFYEIDDAVVRNIVEDGGAATRSVSDILRYSLNTGATWLLMQMGGGELNEQGRVVWHDYLVNKYRLSQPTGIEQGYEEPGFVPDPVDGFGLNIQYANTSFGQGISATPLQMIAAVAAAINGGTYYQPTLVAGHTDENGDFVAKDPTVVEANVVSPEVSRTLVDFMQVVAANNGVTRQSQRAGYIVGGKTGTAEIATPAGGYFEDKFNGTYVGYVGGDTPQYITIVRVNEPGIPGYAGSQAAGPVFNDIITMLIDNFSVQTTTNPG